VKAKHVEEKKEYVSKVHTLFEADTGTNRLDQIYAQLKELQNFKDEIMDDLDDFMSEVDSGQVVKLPEQFDEVVEIVV
jgi:DNA-binding transcriptional regulator GbsR (MarR family)